MDSPVSAWRAGGERFVAFLALWSVLLPSMQPADVALGVLTAGAASWLSLVPLPAETGRVHLLRLLLLLPRFLWQSVRAGIDVARRAFDPRLPIHPGLIEYRTGFAVGPARDAFTIVTSLLPGSLPVAEAGDVIVYHCLDSRAPVARQLAIEERVLGRVLAGGSDG
jgi:multicomponent Na+:H+ antiporter subunit E